MSAAHPPEPEQTGGGTTPTRRPLYILAVIVLAALAGGAWYFLGKGRPVSDEDAVAIFTDLHAGIYDAFSRDSESAIYDVLAESVDGAILDRIYQEVYSGLVDRQQGGAISRIAWVQITHADVTEASAEAFMVDCTWLVSSEVSHAGHSHMRLNEYRGIYRVRSIDGTWKIVDDRILSEKRLSGPDTAAPEQEP